jgi:hypothetical protein
MPPLVHAIEGPWKQACRGEVIFTKDALREVRDSAVPVARSVQRLASIARSGNWETNAERTLLGLAHDERMGNDAEVYGSTKRFRLGRHGKIVTLVPTGSA